MLSFEFWCKHYPKFPERKRSQEKYVATNNTVQSLRRASHHVRKIEVLTEFLRFLRFATHTNICFQNSAGFQGFENWKKQSESCYLATIKKFGSPAPQPFPLKLRRGTKRPLVEGKRSAKILRSGTSASRKKRPQHPLKTPTIHQEHQQILLCWVYTSLSDVV